MNLNVYCWNNSVNNISTSSHKVLIIQQTRLKFVTTMAKTKCDSKMTITLYPQDIKRIWILFWKYTGNCMTRMRPKYRFLDYHNQTGWQVATGQLVYHVTKSANVNGSGSCGKLYLGHTRLHPEDMWHWPNDGLILVHSHRHWPDRFNVWIVQLTL